VILSREKRSFRFTGVRHCRRLHLCRRGLFAHSNRVTIQAQTAGIRRLETDSVSQRPSDSSQVT
jgi:hypothetical protein